ncbi:NAD-dependent epimerase/dehydratase family protein [Paenibacillus sp. GCM10027626]|uniref:NAD-dependent epimerase/dehydratase family protein n=1 Tax=Paenibacillus sp. GCM10027626 TaxID=3273411 RepID=UPI003645AF4E
MKVLVTGGYGFIGSFVAERFHKEGYEVFLVDDMSTGNKKNIDFKHTGYILPVEDRKCEEIFRSTQFDAVVHLAAQVDVTTSMSNPRLDTKSNILGLSNMLSLSHKYGVKKFIFASSAAIYGQNDRLPLPESEPGNPISPYGLNKWLGETYCQKWKEIYNLETICFRFSNVYGPRQGSVGEGGVISIFNERTITGKDLTVFGDGGQTRDFIYVEDVADAIYRASYSTLTGVYNLSTNTETSVNELVETLRALHGPIEVKYKESRPGDIYRSTLDNTRIKNALDWTPKYSFSEGLKKTYEWFAGDQKSKEAVANKEETTTETSSFSKFFRASLPYAENLLAFAITAWATLSLQDTMYDLIDFRLVYIIFLGILYGNRQSLIAVALSIFLFIYQQLFNGREMVSLLNDTNFFFHTAVYLFIGLIVGYAIERKNLKIHTLEESKATLEEKYTFLNDVYNETRLVKDGLQMQVLNNNDSFGKIYSVTKELESLEPEKIFTSTISVLESTMKGQGICIYTTNKNGTYLRLVSHSSGGSFNSAKSLKVDEEPFARHVLQERTLFVNKDLDGHAPMLAAPVFNNGIPVIVIAIYNMPFENFTLSSQNLFSVTVELVSSALARALAYVQATEEQRYLPGTSILKPEVFLEIVNSKEQAKSKHGIDYVLLSASPGKRNLLDWSNEISRVLRETDYIGAGEHGEIMVLLSNSTNEEAAHVLERLKSNGIYLHLTKEDEQYV